MSPLVQRGLDPLHSNFQTRNQPMSGLVCLCVHRTQCGYSYAGLCRQGNENVFQTKAFLISATTVWLVLAVAGTLVNKTARLWPSGGKDFPLRAYCRTYCNFRGRKRLFKIILRRLSLR